MDIAFDLSAFGLSSEGSSPARTGSSLFSLASNRTSLLTEEEADEIGLGVDMPSLSTPAGGLAGFEIPVGAGTSSLGMARSRANRLPSIFGDEPAIIEDPVFDVDDDGFLHPAMSGSLLPEPELPSIEGQRLGSEAGVLSRAGTEVVAAAEEDVPMLNIDDDMMVFQDSELGPTRAAPQIPLTPEPDGEAAQEGQRLSSSVQPIEESSESAEAPQRRARVPRTIRPARQTELSNRDLNEWDHEYLANMALALSSRQKYTALAEAKKNAEFWVMQQGLGNVAAMFGNDRERHPLAIFSGQSLWGLLKRPERYRKRSRTGSVIDDQDEEERRVRARTSSQEGARVGEGDALRYIEDDGLMFQGEDMEIEPEVGRHAPPSLPDHSSGMPWNLSAGGSRQSSVRPPGSGLIPRLSSSIGGLPGGMELGPPSGLSRRGSRLTSASPLFGRGLQSLSRHSGQGLQDASRLTSNEDEFADLDAQLGAGLDMDFELYGPSATVDTQIAAQSQWVAATLETEAYNFLTFVNTKIQEKVGQQQGEEEEGTDEEKYIMFDDLLPPVQNSPIVGAQALLHVLALTTKGLLEVYQAAPFGDIQIWVVSH